MADCGCSPVTACAYADIDDFKSCGVNMAAFANVPLEDIRLALVRSSRIVDTFLRDRYHLPISAPFDPSLTLWVCHIAAWFLLAGPRGFNPNTGGPDLAVRMLYDDAMKGLRGVANGQQQLCVTQTAPASAQPQVGTNPSRGYGGCGGQDAPFTGPNTWGL